MEWIDLQCQSMFGLPSNQGIPVLSSFQFSPFRWLSQQTPFARENALSSYDTFFSRLIFLCLAVVQRIGALIWIQLKQSILFCFEKTTCLKCENIAPDVKRPFISLKARVGNSVRIFGQKVRPFTPWNSACSINTN